MGIIEGGSVSGVLFNDWVFVVNFFGYFNLFVRVM